MNDEIIEKEEKENFLAIICKEWYKIKCIKDHKLNKLRIDRYFKIGRKEKITKDDTSFLIALDSDGIIIMEGMGFEKHDLFDIALKEIPKYEKDHPYATFPS